MASHPSAACTMQVSSFLHSPLHEWNSHLFEDALVIVLSATDGGSVTPAHHIVRSGDKTTPLISLPVLDAEDLVVVNATIKFTIEHFSITSKLVIQLFALGTTMYNALPTRRALRDISNTTVSLSSISNGLSFLMPILNAIDFSEVSLMSFYLNDAEELVDGLGSNETRAIVSIWMDGNAKPDVAYQVTPQERKEIAKRLVESHGAFFCYYISPYIESKDARDNLNFIGERPLHPFREQTFKETINLHASGTVILGISSSGTIVPSIEALTKCNPSRFTSRTLDAAIIAALAIMPPVLKGRNPVHIGAKSSEIFGYVEKLNRHVAGNDSPAILRACMVAAKAACLIANIFPYDTDARVSQTKFSSSESTNGGHCVGLVAESADCDGQARIAVEALLAMMNIASERSEALSLAKVFGRAVAASYTPVFLTAGAMGLEGRHTEAHSGFDGDLGKNFVSNALLDSHALGGLFLNSMISSALLADEDAGVVQGFVSNLPAQCDTSAFPPYIVCEGTMATHPCANSPHRVTVPVTEREKRVVQLDGIAANVSLESEYLSEEGRRMSDALSGNDDYSVHGPANNRSGVPSFVRVLTEVAVFPFEYISSSGEHRFVSSFYIGQERMYEEETLGVSIPDVQFPRIDTSITLHKHRSFTKGEITKLLTLAPSVGNLQVFDKAAKTDALVQELNEALATDDTDLVAHAAHAVFQSLVHDRAMCKEVVDEMKLIALSSARSIEAIHHEMVEAGVFLRHSRDGKRSRQTFAVSSGLLYNVDVERVKNLASAALASGKSVSLTLVIYSDNGLSELFVQTSS